MLGCALLCFVVLCCVVLCCVVLCCVVLCCVVMCFTVEYCVVSRFRHPQLQVDENVSYLLKGVVNFNYLFPSRAKS